VDKKPDLLTGDPAFENIRRQTEAAQHWHETEGKRLAEVAEKIRALGGFVTSVHDETTLSFPEDTPKEKQEEMLLLFLGREGIPKVPIKVDAEFAKKWRTEEA
jgi:hypothetical protein